MDAMPMERGELEARLTSLFSSATGAAADWQLRTPPDRAPQRDPFAPDSPKSIVSASPFAAIVPPVQNTFIDFRPTRPSWRRADSMPEPGSSDAKARDVHALHYRPTPICAVDSALKGGAEESCDDSGGEEAEPRPQAVEDLTLREDWPEISAKIPRDADGALTSIGSVGHAAGECRPCVFANSGKGKVCENGVSCLFCHFWHEPKKRTRISKKRRQEKRIKELRQGMRKDSYPIVFAYPDGYPAPDHVLNPWPNGL
jgi:hypothetical protein